MKAKTCKNKNCDNPAWSGGCCKNHVAQKPMKKKRVTTQTWEEDTNLMHTFFMHIWRRRRHKSEVSGALLGKEPLSIFFHHILPKNKYVDAAFDPENIILMTGDEHNNVENDMYKYEEVNKRRELLLIKYDLI